MANGLSLEQIITLGSGADATDSLPEIMKEAVAQSVKEKRNTTLQTLTNVLKSGQDQIKSQVAELRRIRALESKQKNKVDTLQAAFNHFKNTGNPLPYYKANGDHTLICRFFEQVGLDSEDFPTNHPIWQVSNPD